MRNTVLRVAVAILLFATPSMAGTPEPASDPDMKRIYDADQAERTDLGTGPMKPGADTRDAERRDQTRRLMAEGRLHTGQDFTEAAYVFQHGHGDDFLLAHTLAVIATKKGDPEGPAIAAKTLDRYLQSHGGKQIYGTQSLYSSATGIWTQDPYDRDLISDALRVELNVPDLASQRQKLDDRQAHTPAVAAPAAAPAAAHVIALTCDGGPVSRIYVQATWQLQACDHGILRVSGGEPVVTLLVHADRDTVAVSPLGAAQSPELKVVTAMFQAMTPAQLADVAARTRAGS